MPNSLRLASIVLFAVLGLAGCGSKGPLVLPDQKPQTQPQQPTATPAPPQDSGNRQ